MPPDLEVFFLSRARLENKVVGLNSLDWNKERWAIEQYARLFPGGNAAASARERTDVIDSLNAFEATIFRLKCQGLVLGNALDLDMARPKVLQIIRGGK